MASENNLCDNHSNSKMTSEYAISTIVGEIASITEQLKDHMEINVDALINAPDIDILLNNIMLQRSSLVKMIGQLNYMKPDYDVSSHQRLSDDCKNLIKILMEKKYRHESDKKHVDKYSHIFAFKNLLDIAVNRFFNTCKIDITIIDNAELTLLNDNLPAVRDDYRELCKLYCDLVEKCPFDMPDRDTMFSEYNTKIKEAESCKVSYEKSILSALKERELTSDKIKNPANEIKLSCFSGYKSGPDYYSFKSQFLNKFRRYTQVDKVSILKNTYLKDEAYNTCKELYDLDDIWDRLKEEFGDPKFMLRSKIGNLLSIGNFNKCKTISEKRETVLKTINILSDLFNLVEQHGLHIDLYCKNDKAFSLMLKQIPKLWLHDWHFLKLKENPDVSHKTDILVKDEKTWKLFKKFLQEKLRHLKEEENMEECLKEFSIHDKNPESRRGNVCDCTLSNSFDYFEEPVYDADYYDENDASSYSYRGDHIGEQCILCNASRHLHYWDCIKFMNMKHGERYELFINPKDGNSKSSTIGKLMGECAACLVPGEKVGHGCHYNDQIKEWLCHFKHQRPLHILCCRHHADENLELWEKFQFNTKFGFLTGDDFIPSWKRTISWKNNVCKFQSNKKSSYSSDFKSVNVNSYERVVDDGLFLLQKILVDSHTYNVFYDTGCSDFCITETAIRRLNDRATILKEGKFDITGAGGGTVCTSDGIYEIKLPLATGKEALFVGLSMPKLTAEFPEYEVLDVYREIVDDYVKLGGSSNDLPIYNPSYTFGGNTDIMIGIKYNRYQPKLIHQMDSGLAVYRSAFIGPGGCNTVIGGPHPIITKIEKQFYDQGSSTCHKELLNNLLSNEYRKYCDGYTIFPDAMITKSLNDVDFRISSYNLANKKLSTFMECENAGSEISYRCLKCRECVDCKCGIMTEEISRKEEVEQYLIDKSISLDIDKCCIECYLPVSCDPSLVLGKSNCAKKVFIKWREKLHNSPSDLASVIKSELKLQVKGHVDFIKNLNDDQRNFILNCPYQYIIPWRPVWKESSQTTPCRITFDAGSKTDSGKSLNDILPKGINQINSLLEILLKWRNGVFAMASDIEQMYNGVKLHEKHWPLQLYWWTNDLKRNTEPELKVIKTLIYGVRSSGSQAIKGVKLIAEKFKQDYPIVYKTLTEQIYVDDILPQGQESLDCCYKLADELISVLARGGLNLKRFVFSTLPPDVSVSEEGEYINVGGMKWFPVTDHLQLSTGRLNFSKKYRGKFSENHFAVPDRLTRRMCTSKVGEVFDILGQFVPITAKFKLDLHYLVVENFDWDDEIPQEIRKVWVSNFGMIQKLDDLKFSRATVPQNAVNLDMQTIEAGDASSKMICVAVYVRFRLKSGAYSCQLVLGKSKIVPSSMSIPRAELLAAKINSSASHIVKRAFGEYIKESWKITDSKVVLFWLNSWKKSLKIWTYNCVNEILRFSSVTDWYLVASALMPCDMGTRGIATVYDCESIWRNGLPWMCEHTNNFPLKSYNEIQLESFEKDIYEKELVPSAKLFVTHNRLMDIKISDKIKERLMFSNYLIEPNRFRFQKSVRIIGLVLKFIIKISKVLVNRQFWFSNVNNYKFKVFSTHINKDGNNDKNISEWSSMLQNYFNYTNKDDLCCNESIKKPILIYPSEHETQMSLQYFYRIATKEVEEFGRNTKAFKESVVINGIRYWKGRLLESQGFVHPDRKLMSNVMADMSPSMFCVPLVDQFSPIAWSIIYDIHWFHSYGKHSGVATSKRISREFAYIINVREICELFRKTCSRCRWIEKRVLSVEYGPLSDFQLTLAPAFYITQIDLMGPFMAYQINVRSTLKIWFTIFVCVVTSTVNIQVMEDYSSGSFVSAFIRFSSNNCFPRTILSDQGKNIEHGVQNMEINWTDVSGQLFYSYGVELYTCSVGGHHQHGKVERKIRHIKESFLKNFYKEKVSVLQWQTVAEETANCINNLPIGVGSARNIDMELDDLDVITPNRLKFGRNNERSPVNPVYISNDPFRFINTNMDIFNSWWEHWLINAVPELIEKPINWKSGRNIMKGDIVIFLKSVGSIGPGVYHYGIIDTVITDRDNIVRNALVKYRNANESQDRLTKRSIKSLVIIHCVDELDIMTELHEASSFVDSLKSKISN